MRSLEQRLWNVVFLALAILELLFAVILGYATIQRPHEVPERPDLEYSLGPFLDAFGRISGLEPSVTVQGAGVSNLYVSDSSLKNVGTAPILPDDFHQQLILQVDNPWRILDVNSRRIGVPLDWSRASDTEYVAEPTLLNPGDKAYFNIYVTNDAVELPSAEDVEAISLTITARITNVSTLKDSNRQALEALDKMRRGRDFSGPFIVVLDTWEILAVLLLSASYLLMYLRLLSLDGILARVQTWPSVALICAASLVSMAASESTIDVLFAPAFAFELIDLYIAAPQTFIGRFGAKHWANYAILLLHFGLMLVLLVRIQRKSKQLGSTIILRGSRT